MGHVILTESNARPTMTEMAVTEMRQVKHSDEEDTEAQRGIKDR